MNLPGCVRRLSRDGGQKLLILIPFALKSEVD